MNRIELAGYKLNGIWHAFCNILGGSNISDN